MCLEPWTMLSSSLQNWKVLIGISEPFIVDLFEEEESEDLEKRNQHQVYPSTAPFLLDQQFILLFLMSCYGSGCIALCSQQMLVKCIEPSSWSPQTETIIASCGGRTLFCCQHGGKTERNRVGRPVPTSCKSSAHVILHG